MRLKMAALQLSLRERYAPWQTFWDHANASATVVWESYWRFIIERDAIYHKRLRNEKPPWTDDNILQKHKFTNVFRACDRVSQYLIKEIIYNSAYSQESEEVVFRILLFKFFNHISTWDSLKAQLGVPTWKNFNEAAYVQVLDELKAKGIKMFSGAYQHNDLSNCSDVSPEKHPRYIRPLKEMMDGGVTAELQKAHSYEQAFNIIQQYALHANFIGMQHLVDINYSEVINFDENDFIIPGHGCLNGMRKCFGLPKAPSTAEAQAIHYRLVDQQDAFFEACQVPPVTLFGRKLHCIDFQNVFFETDKYARHAHPEFNLKSRTGRVRDRIKTFKVTDDLPAPFFPPKWNLKVVL